MNGTSYLKHFGRIAYPITILLLTLVLFQHVHGEPAVVNVTATLSDQLGNDGDNDGNVDPGDTITYTAVIANNGTTDAEGVVFSDTVDANTTLVLGSLTVTPLAGDDDYMTVGNTLLQVCGTQTETTAVFDTTLLTDNDSEFLGDSFTVTAIDAASANGGTVTNDGNGCFRYLPPVNFTGNDTFDYTITSDEDGSTTTATATIMVADMVWYVDVNAGAGGDGRSNAPFETLTEAQTASSANHIIYMFAGSYPQSIVLKDGQSLVGEGVALMVGGKAIRAAGNRPIIENSGNGILIEIAQNNTIRGLDTGTKPTGGAAVRSPSDFGTLTIDNMAIAGQGRAFSLIGNGTLAVTLDSVASSDDAAGIDINGAIDGSFTVSQSTTITDSTGVGINVANSSATYNFGNTTVTSSAATSTGINLFNNVGATFTFDSLNASTNGAGLSANNSGTVTVLGSSNTISGSNSPAVSLVNTTIGASGVTFQSVTSSGGASGILLNNTGGSGLFAVNGGNISNHSQEGIFLNNVQGGATFDGLTIDQSTTANTQGVDATNVFNLTIDNSTITAGSSNSYALLGNSITNWLSTSTIYDGGGGSVPNIDGVRITNLLGNNTLTDSTFRNGKDINLLIENTSATNAAPGAPDTLTIRGVTFGNSAGGDHLQMDSNGTANLKLDLGASGGGNTTFSGTAQDGIQLEAQGSSTFQALITGATFNNTLGSAVNLSATGSGRMIARVHGLTGLTSSGTNVLNTIGFNTSNIDVTWEDNTITSATAGNGIRIVQEGNGMITANVKDNNVQGVTQGSGIIAQGRAGTSGNGRINLTLDNNFVRTTTALALDGIEVTSGSSAGGDTNTICLNMFNNNSAADAASGLDGYFLRHRTGSTFQLQDFAGPSDTAGITNWVNNTKSNTGSVFISGASNFVNAPSACATPTTPTRAAASVALPQRSEVTAAPLAPTAGETISVTIGTLPAGKSVTVAFAVTVNAPLPAGVSFVSTQGTVAGDNFADVLTDDPDTGATNDATVTTIDAAPDMQIVKDDIVDTVLPGGIISYTLTFTNVGSQGATNVTLTETVPANTTFAATISTAGWTCPDGAPAGSACTINVGSLAGGGAAGSAIFAVLVDAGISSGITTITNEAGVLDDGTNGTDLNPSDNVDGDTTDVLHPEIAVLGNGVEIADGDFLPDSADNTNFGAVEIGNIVTKTFVISNSGSADLQLTGTPLVTVTGSSAFSVVQSSTTPVGPQATTTFQIQYAPVARSIENATVEIASNDFDEPIYDFVISANKCQTYITVQNGNDAGAGSLRQAVDDLCPTGGLIDFTAGLSGGEVTLAEPIILNKPATTISGTVPVTISGGGTSLLFDVVASAEVTFTHLTFANAAHNFGSGGAFTSNGTLLIDNSTLNNNTSSAAGGAIYVAGGTTTLRKSTVSGNTATTTGGGVSVGLGTLTAINSTFVDNQEGGGGGANIDNGGTLHLINSLLTSTSGSADCVNTGTLATNINNLIEDGSCAATFAGNPNVGALANNGGKTATHALLFNSPAVDLADDASCPAADQRGRTRTDDHGCDIGAFEMKYSDSDNVFRDDLVLNETRGFGPTLVLITPTIGSIPSAHITKTVAPPPGLVGDAVDVYWEVTTNATTYSVDVKFCYTEAELMASSVTNENALTLYRSVAGADPWLAVMDSDVDVAANCVSATGVTEFSFWAIAEIGATEVGLQNVRSADNSLIPLLITIVLAAVLLTAIVWRRNHIADNLS